MYLNSLKTQKKDTMNSINNLDDILKLIDFPEGYFYHLQIIKRKKEHKDLGSNSTVVKTYYVSSEEYLRRKMPEIIALSDFHNARACINLNKRSYEKIAYHMMRKVCDQIMNKDFKSVGKAYESVCGTYSDESNKKWIVDFDDTDINLLNTIANAINSCEPHDVVDKIYGSLNTKNGIHLITHPFRLDQFKVLHPAIDVHKDNPTIIYCPIQSLVNQTA